nr:YitT family protein [uncultured Faecalimonas sp.]
MKEATKAELKEVFSLKRIMWVLIGNTIYSCGIAAFVLPNDLITGGTTGIALILEHYFGLPIGLSVAIFNIIMFILAILILGKSFALTALISTFYFPWILSQFQKVQFIQNMTDDFLLGSIFAGLMLGLGVGLVIRAGASTGGMDIPPLILNKKFGLPVSVGLYVFDFTILIIQMSFRDKERILYGILLVLIYSTLVDKVLLMGKTQMQVKIISDHYEEINKVIQEKLDRGSTFFKTESGYLRKDSFAIMTVVSSRELPKLNELVLEIDQQAFIVINQVNEVMGRGFTLHKQAE